MLAWKDLDGFACFERFETPILEHFCPLFTQIAHMGLILPIWVSFCPEYHPQPLFFTQPSQSPFSNIYVHKTPPTPEQNPSFPGLNMKVGKLNYSLHKLDPNWAKCLKSGQIFSRIGVIIIIYCQKPQCQGLLWLEECRVGNSRSQQAPVSRPLSNFLAAHMTSKSGSYLRHQVDNWHVFYLL